MSGADLLETWGTHLSAARRRSPHTVRAYLACAARLLEHTGIDTWDGLARIESNHLRAQLAARRADGIGNASAARELQMDRANLIRLAKRLGLYEARQRGVLR